MAGRYPVTRTNEAGAEVVDVVSEDGKEKGEVTVGYLDQATSRSGKKFHAREYRDDAGNVIERDGKAVGKPKAEPRTGGEKLNAKPAKAAKKGATKAAKKKGG